MLSNTESCCSSAAAQAYDRVGHIRSRREGQCDGDWGGKHQASRADLKRHQRAFCRNDWRQGKARCRGQGIGGATTFRVTPALTASMGQMTYACEALARARRPNLSPSIHNFISNTGGWPCKTPQGSDLVLSDADDERVVGDPQDLIVLCAGVNSAELLEGDFGRLPMIAERGYHFQLDQSSLDNLDLDSPLVFEDRSLIVTPFSHGLRMASFTEFSHPKAPADAGKWRRLKQHASDLGIQTAHGESSTWVGCRPTLPDYLPAIGRSRESPNLILACGHNHLGLTLAAVTGKLVRQLARHQAPTIDISALAPQRYISKF